MGTSVPAGTTAPADYKVFQYIDITPTNLVNTNLKDITIKFTVDKSWLTANNVQEANVALLHYDNGWVPLPTQVLASGSTSVTFSATTSGFSHFAVAGKQSAPSTAPAPDTATSNATTPEETTGEDGTPTNDSDTDGTTKEKSKSKISWLWLLAIVIILGAVGAYFFFANKPDNKMKL